MPWDHPREIRSSRTETWNHLFAERKNPSKCMLCKHLSILNSFARNFIDVKRRCCLFFHREFIKYNCRPHLLITSLHHFLSLSSRHSNVHAIIFVCIFHTHVCICSAHLNVDRSYNRLKLKVCLNGWNGWVSLTHPLLFLPSANWMCAVDISRLQQKCSFIV